jgi:hypothetical protein
MKKSEAFRLAQYSVIKNQTIGTDEKLDVLKVLIAEEEMARFVEERAEKEKRSKENANT